MYEIRGYRIRYPAMNLEKWNLESEKWSPEPKNDSGGGKMEPGVCKGAREKSRVREDNPPCGSGSQVSVGPIY